MPGDRVNIRVAVHADLEQTVGFKYAGVEATRARRSRGAARRARRRPPAHPPPRPQLGRAGATAGGAYELGGSEFTRVVPLQPYPDPQRLNVSWRERETGLAPA